MTMIQYKALYRKYRPRTFAQVKGQDHIVQTLENIIKSQKISHGYLFSGPRGTGKTSVAKIFANTINCQDKQDVLQPCNKCLANIESAMDIIEMDAASNNGVDEIRDLKEKAQSLPFNSQYKIYIIDEVHMLSKNAFNAFLKILEEPPKHVIFILATTDPQKLPLTILSRLQRFNFRKIENSIIEKQVVQVLENEAISFEIKAIKTIAKLANGGLRDALSMVDQVSIYGNGNVEQQALFEVFGITSVENLLEIFKLSNERKLTEVLSFAKKLVEMGADVQLLSQGLMSVLKDYIVYKKTHQEELLDFLEVGDLLEVKLSLFKAYKYLGIVVDLIKELNYSQIPNQVLELSLIKLATNDQELIDNKRFDELEETIIDVNSTMNSNQKLMDQIDNSSNQVNNQDVITSLDFKDVIFEEAVPSSKSDEDIFDIMFGAKEKPKDEVVTEAPVEPELEVAVEPEAEAAPEPETIEDPDAPIELEHIEIPFDNLEDMLPSYKRTHPVRETDPKKILDIKNLSNHNMIESIEVNKELQAQIDREKEEQMQILLEQERLKQLEEQKLQEDLLNEHNSSEGAMDSIVKENNRRELTFAKYMTEEINLANSQGELIKKDFYNMNQLINLFIIAKREIQDSNVQRWTRLETYQASEKYYEYIAYLLNTKLISSGKEFILISSEENDVIWKVNSFIKQDNFKELIAKVIGHPVHVVAITKGLFQQAKKAWRDLESKPEGVELTPVVLKTKKELTEEYAKELFKN